MFSSLCIFVPIGVLGEAGEKSPGILELMTAEQYHRAGLHKLSADELRALEGWLRDHAGEFPAVGRTAPAADPAPGAPAAAAAPEETSVEENFGFPDPPADGAEVLHARIEQPFRGWSGKTVFLLDNGQVWKQRASGHFTYSGDDTRVVISKNSWGFFVMRLVDADRSVGVRRVK